MRFGFYGTLRKGWGNAKYTGLEATGELLGTTPLLGWEMYSGGYAPAICRGNDVVILEVWDIPDTEEGRRVVDCIRSLERAYSEELVETEKWGAVTVYTQDCNRLRSRGWPLVKGGDWNQYNHPKRW